MDVHLPPTSDPHIEVEKRKNPDGSTSYVLTLTGAFDFDIAGQLRDELITSLNAIPRAVVVHLAGVTFMDSSVLGALVAAARRARQLGVALRLAAVPPLAARLLRLTAMTRFFSLHRDVATALNVPSQRPRS